VRCATRNGTEPLAHYVDTSALVKLVVDEPETAALRRWLRRTDREPVSSDVTRTELLRAVRRGAPDRVELAREVLDSVTLVEVTTAICELAGRLDPAILRSLDAIHLAAAIDLGDDLEAVVVYDERLADAARANGLIVVAPG
jgi:predicted nucleic acid-binding protein